MGNHAEKRKDRDRGKGNRDNHARDKKNGETRKVTRKMIRIMMSYL